MGSSRFTILQVLNAGFYRKGLKTCKMILPCGGIGGKLKQTAFRLFMTSAVKRSDNI
jgi:hypothetical protein